MPTLLPPLLFLIAAFSILLISILLPASHLLDWPLTLIGSLPLFLGIVLSVSGQQLFKRKQTNIMTFGQPDKLVTDHLFKYSRNPMYLGFSLALFGIYLLCGSSLFAAMIVIGFFLACNFIYIPFEEQRMKACFGAEYEWYCQAVRRWL